MAQGAWVEKWSQLDLLKLNSFSFGITGFILAMDTVVLPVIVLTVAPEGFKNTYLAVLGISGLLMAAMVQPTIGRISDRYQSRLGRRVPFILWGATFAAIGLIGIRLAPNFGVLFAVWIFIQANVNIAYGPGLALIRDCVPLDRIGMASSMKILSDAIGAAVMIAIAGALIGKTGSSIDWEWLTLGILAFLLMVGISVTTVQVSRRELNTPLNAQRRDIESSFRSALNPQLGLFLISRLVMIMAISSFQTYGLFFLRDSVGLDDPAAALGRMILVIAGALAIAVYLAGLVSDRLGRKPVVMVGAIGAALSTMWMLTASNSTEVLIIASVIGASIGVLQSANWALANELADEAQAGLHMGIVNLATIGGAAGAKMLGPGIDALNRIPGRSDDFGYQVLIAGAAGFFILGAILLMPLKTTGREAVSGDASPPPA
ncbi:MAG TPA: MFS transporter [Dehalococcoidia bacterium]|nr:MFS transporter [Dehalococcoidia bacterium]